MTMYSQRRFNIRVTFVNKFCSQIFVYDTQSLTLEFKISENIGVSLGYPMLRSLVLLPTSSG